MASNADLGAERGTHGRARRADDPLWVIVLAGGQGRRLANFVRTTIGDTRPKQFCRIIGRRSMLRHTWDRAGRLVDGARVVSVITKGQEDYLKEEARQARIPGRVLVQPDDRGTGPGLLLPLLWIAHRQPDACVAVFPADHFIWEESRFLGYVANAVIESRRRPDRVVLLGLAPDTPETDYGWIQPGAPQPRAFPRGELFTVARFIEKPEEAAARQLQATGGVWNSGVMAGTVYAFLQLLRSARPEAVEALQIAARHFETSAGQAAMAAVYKHLPAFDFSRDVLAPGHDTLLVELARHLMWSDWGEPTRILQVITRLEGRPISSPRLGPVGQRCVGVGSAREYSRRLRVISNPGGDRKGRFPERNLYDLANVHCSIAKEAPPRR